MSLNLNWDGKLEDEGPQPPSGLSLIAGSEKDAILDVAVAVHNEENFACASDSEMIAGRLTWCERSRGHTA